jgi:outer membrane lipoprotein-sorting protein
MRIAALRAIVLFCLALLVPLVAGAADAKEKGGASVDPQLAAVLSRFDEVQRGIHSLSADFSQTTVNPLLREPQQARGRFYMRKPDSVLWEYDSPESMKFAIDKGEYTGYFPGRKKAERRDVHRWTEQIFRFFAVGQVSEELRKFYHIRLEEPGPDMKGTVLLVLDPSKRRVRKRVDEVRFWVDSTTYFPAKVQYVNSQGATRTLVFQGVQMNPDLSASLFDVRIPEGVTVTNGFSELGSVAAPSAH